MKMDRVISYAKRMRNNPTKAEAEMWKVLRNKNLLFLRFNRQYVICHTDAKEIIRFYIADFYCGEVKLIVEVDGEYHQEKEQIQYDEIRTQTLNELGFHVVRFSNTEVLNDIDTVVKKLRAFIKVLDGQKK